MMGGKTPQQGFTMLELLLVVALLAIFAVAAIPMLSSSSDRKAELEGAQIESIIRHAQVLARTRQEAYRVRFDIDGEYVVLFDVAGGIPAPGEGAVNLDRLSSDEEDYVWYLKHGQIESADFGGRNRIDFNANGEASVGGSAVISFGDYGLTITVAATTGCVTMQGAWR
ncbi:MAG: prepilin-type N-terminal cleavage/methylation domain-containing protein [Planctomycetes bacterium]|nr:prepilin-type N-terminal cleavage/methylation domain-containing protein [Planctomycetota bacterium]